MMGIGVCMLSTCAIGGSVFLTLALIPIQRCVMVKLGAKYLVFLIKPWLPCPMDPKTISAAGSVNFQWCLGTKTGKQTVAATSSLDLSFPA